MQQFEGMTHIINEQKKNVNPHISIKLTKKFFRHFILGLCHNNLNQIPGEKFPTTSEDLEGFWDMLLLQVDHVNSIFAEIEELKKNNWQVSCSSFISASEHVLPS